MVVIGNPPYSGISSNMGKWITDLIEDYKYVDGEHFGERKHWLHDDYVKFIRFGQHMIEKNGEGVLAFINNRSFLDNPTFRGMRWNLLQEFDSIYVLDLFGDSKRVKFDSEGVPDKNVFDISVGVSINIFVKNGTRKLSPAPGRVHYAELLGIREKKYANLNQNSLSSIEFSELWPIAPYYFFQPQNFSLADEYSSGISVSDLMPEQTMGITSARDDFVIDIDRNTLQQRVTDFSRLDKTDAEIRQEYFGHKKEGKYARGDTRGWKLADARRIIRSFDHTKLIRPISYRPFDSRFIYYTPEMVDWDRRAVMQHLMRDNLAICLVKVGRNADFHNYLCANDIVDKAICSSLDNANIFPLYLYPDESQEKGGQAALPLDVRKSSAFPSDGQQEESGSAAVPHRVPNLNMEIVGKIAEGLGLTFVSEPGAAATGLAEPPPRQPKAAATPPDQEGSFSGTTTPSAEAASTPPGTVGEFKTFAPIDILDYIYAVLHSPTYREKYKEFLKIDFPRVPYPKDAETFWRLVALGGELRQIHLLESPVVNKFITGYPVTGDNAVVKPEYKNGSVYINPEQYFSDVPETAWNFYIGGYQPAQKWLKDRKGRTLSFDDIRHYQKIIVALSETGRLMKEIDLVFQV